MRPKVSSGTNGIVLQVLIGSLDAPINGLAHRSAEDTRLVPLSDPSTCSKGRSGILTYSITSSACASSVGGLVRPSALAVVRFSTSSNLPGCSARQVCGAYYP